MNSNQKDNQSGQGSRVDDSKKQALDRGRSDNDQRTAKQSADNDDDFLSGDNAPNNQNNPSRDYNQKSMSPAKNPNIGGNENEYEVSTTDADEYREDTLADNNDGFVERRDSEEINRHEDENRYSSPTTRNRSEE